MRLRIATVIAAFVLLAASACGQGNHTSNEAEAKSARRPSYGVVTSLPLFWGEGRFGDAVGGRDQRAPFVQILSQNSDVRPIDAIDASALENIETLILAQPRRLAPHELVAIDDWVRAGGSAVVFADPMLVWPSRYPLGDMRRAPPITMLDPLFAHWGLTLNGGSDGRREERMLGAAGITAVGSGRWTGKVCAVELDQLVARCAIGRGRAILVADADMLNIEVEGQSDVIPVFALLEEAAQRAH